MAIDMGIGPLGFQNLIFKRKFRWTFTVNEICGSKTIPPHFVKLAARPSLSIEETEINHLNAKTWIPGKASWETINVTYIDAIDPTNVSFTKPLFDWLASVYAFHLPNELPMGSSRNQYAAVGILVMYDGCGEALERWELNDMWPTSVNFGDVDYSSSDEATIDLTLRYSSVKYEALCPTFQPESCCVPCGTSPGSGGLPPLNNNQQTLLA